MRQPARSTTTIAIALALCALLTSTILTTAACAKQPRDTSQLSDEAKRELSVIPIVKGINDVSTAVIAANRAGQVNDTIAVRVLAINKQVLDVLTPPIAVGWQALAQAAIANARQGLPPELAATIGPYIDAVQRVLNGLSVNLTNQQRGVK